MEASFCCPVLHDWKHIRARTKFGERKPGSGALLDLNLTLWSLKMQQHWGSVWSSHRVAGALRLRVFAQSGPLVSLCILLASLLPSRATNVPTERDRINNLGKSEPPASSARISQIQRLIFFSSLFSHVRKYPVDLEGINLGHYWHDKPLAWELFQDLLCPEFVPCL